MSQSFLVRAQNKQQVKEEVARVSSQIAQIASSLENLQIAVPSRKKALVKPGTDQSSYKPSFA